MVKIWNKRGQGMGKKGNIASAIIDNQAYVLFAIVLLFMIVLLQVRSCEREEINKENLDTVYLDSVLAIGLDNILKTEAYVDINHGEPGKPIILEKFTIGELIYLSRIDNKFYPLTEQKIKEAINVMDTGCHVICYDNRVIYDDYKCRFFNDRLRLKNSCDNGHSIVIPGHDKNIKVGYNMIYYEGERL